jgi:Rieske Fe-S protein
MTHAEQDATAAHPDRRAVIRGVGAVGLAAAGAAVVAGCGSSSTAGAPAAGSSSGGSGSAATQSAAGSSDSDGIDASEVPVGGGTIVAATKTVITQPAAGQFKAFSSICTHMGCPVASVADGTINCNCHGSRYDIATGQVKRGPAKKPLPPKTVTVKGDRITVT